MEGELKARALAAASAARFAGFFETSKALIEIAKQCDCERGDQAYCEHATTAGWLGRPPKHLLA